MSDMLSRDGLETFMIRLQGSINPDRVEAWNRIDDHDRSQRGTIAALREQVAKMEVVVEAAWDVSLSMDTMPGVVVDNAPIWGHLTTLQCALNDAAGGGESRDGAVLPDSAGGVDGDNAVRNDWPAPASTCPKAPGHEHLFTVNGMTFGMCQRCEYIKPQKKEREE